MNRQPLKYLVRIETESGVVVSPWLNAAMAVALKVRVESRADATGTWIDVTLIPQVDCRKVSA